MAAALAGFEPFVKNAYHAGESPGFTVVKGAHELPLQ